MSWFPDALVQPLLLLKGTLALLSILTLSLHLWRRGQARSFRTRGQELRYVTLFATSLVLAEASFEQALSDTFEIGPRNLLGLALSVLLLVTVWVSLREGGDPQDESH